jgi:tape measure domain-containing protein
VTSFEIDVSINTRKAAAQLRSFGIRLESLQKESERFKTSIQSALAARDQGLATSINRVNNQLTEVRQTASEAKRRVETIGQKVNTRGIVRAKNELEKVRREARQTANALRGAFAGVSFALVARQFISLSDAYTRTQNRLRILTDSQDQLNQTYVRLNEIANRTRQPIEAISTLYSRVALAAGELGVSQQEISTFTERVGVSLAVQGTSATEASGALLQLSQAIASGIVRAEEFNSVNEGAPPILLAVARGSERFGGSVNKLRTAVLAGTVTSREFFDAFIKGSAETERQFGRTVPTIDQGFVALNNSITDTVGKFNEATGASEGIARALIFASQNIVPLAAGAASLAFTVGGPLVINLAKASTAFTGLTGSVLKAAGGFTVIVTAAAAVAVTIQELGDEIRATNEGIDDLRVTAAANGAQILMIQREINQITQRAAQQNRELTDSERDRIAVLKERLTAQRAEARQQQETGESARKEAEATKAQAEEKARLDALLREITGGPGEAFKQLQADLKKLADEGRISQEEYNEALQRQKDLLPGAAPAPGGGGASPSIRDTVAQEREKQLQTLRDQVDVEGAINREIEDLLILREREVGLTGEINNRIEELRLRQLQASTEFADGFKAALIEIQREAENLAAVGAQIVDVFANQATDALVELATTGRINFKEFAQSLLADLTRIIARLLIVQAISAATGGGSAIPAGSLNAGRQFGGTVQPGQRPFPVGEDGPEIFQPGRTGRIIPNPRTTEQAGPAQPVNVNIATVRSPSEVFSALRQPDGREIIFNVLESDRERARRAFQQ